MNLRVVGIVFRIIIRVEEGGCSCPQPHHCAVYCTYLHGYKKERHQQVANGHHEKARDMANVHFLVHDVYCAKNIAAHKLNSLR
jgi:hypothetical protein